MPHWVGFSDAEGFIGLRRRGDGNSDATYGVSNSNAKICNDFLTGLRSRGFSGSVYETRLVNGSIQWQLAVATRDVTRLVDKLLLKHEEKVAARVLARRLVGTPWDQSGAIYKGFRSEIKVARNGCVLAAKREFENRYRMKEIRIELENEITRRAHSLRVSGLRPQNIATLLGRSERTIYRRVARENDRIEAGRKTPE